MRLSQLSLRSPQYVAHKPPGIAVLAGILGLLAACSQVPDELNPVEWVEAVDEFVTGEDDDFDPEAQARLEAERAQPVPGEDEPFPTLSSVPERPSGLSTYEERQAMAESLVADRDEARYIDEPIAATNEIDTPWRNSGGGATVAAVEPQVAPPEPAFTEFEETQTVTEAPSLPPPPIQTESVADTSSLYTPQADAVGASRSPAPTVGRTAFPVEPPSVPDVPTWTTVEQDYNQMFAASGGTVVPGAGPQQYAAAGPTGAPSVGSAGPIGDPRFDVVDYSMHAAVIYYNHGSARLSDHDREVLRQVVAAHRDYGGTIRVVGHASSRTKTNDVVEHKLANYEISVDRARGVARALIQMGVSPDAVFVGSMADTAPQFSEATPLGEAANRRADIYLDFWRQHG